MDSRWESLRLTWYDAVSSVEQHRRWLEPSMEVRRLWLRRANVPIAVTGRPAAGKTVLLDALTGNVRTHGYQTRISTGPEPHRLLLRAGSASSRAGFLVVPGQDSEPRERSLEIFRNGKAPVGVVHVVCWGYNGLWNGAQDAALQELNPDASRSGNDRMRRHLLGLEARDFAELCGLLKKPAVQQRLRWLIIAVAKSDLFWSDIADARDYYIPGATSSPFHHVLDDLTAGPRRYPPAIKIVPFAAYPEAHQYASGLHRTASQLDAVQVTALRNNFYDVLGGVL